jgi:hypothetical protein
MCFNKEVSFLSFIFGLIVSIKLFNIKEYLAAISLLLLSSMQFLEFFLWIFIKNKYFNQLLSYIIPILILLQVVGVYVAYYFFTNNKLIIPNTIFLILFALLTIFILYNGSGKLTSVNKSCKLKWNILNFNSFFVGFLYLLSYLFIICSGIYNSYKGDFFGSLIILSLIFSFIFNYFFRVKPSLANNGSFWCFSSLILSTFYFLLII